jgi:uncharacterized protein (DUF305 family)
MKKWIAVGTLAAAATIGVAACGGDDEDPTVGTSDETSSTSMTDDDAAGDDMASDDFNDADVTFAQMMVVHHEQAIEMAQLADGRAESQDVLDLAARIEAAQQPEIEQMQSWLEAWGADDSRSGMDMEDGGMEMSGEMSEEDMTALEAASGAEFERMFLEMMVEHHRGAITMSESEVAEGTNQAAIQLAQKIIDDQEAEIAEIEAMLADMP